jgi:hypothetical protein
MSLYFQSETGISTSFKLVAGTSQTAFMSLQLCVYKAVALLQVCGCPDFRILTVLHRCVDDLK